LQDDAGLETDQAVKTFECLEGFGGRNRVCLKEVRGGPKADVIVGMQGEVANACPARLTAIANVVKRPDKRVVRGVGGNGTLQGRAGVSLSGGYVAGCENIE